MPFFEAGGNTIISVFRCVSVFLQTHRNGSNGEVPGVSHGS